MQCAVYTLNLDWACGKCDFMCLLVYFYQLVTLRSFIIHLIQICERGNLKVSINHLNALVKFRLNWLFVYLVIFSLSLSHLFQRFKYTKKTRHYDEQFAKIYIPTAPHRLVLVRWLFFAPIEYECVCVICSR